LGSSNPVVKALAARALGQIESAAHEAGPELFAVLTDGNSEVRRNAVAALGRIKADLPCLRPALRELLRKDPDAEVVSAAATALGELQDQDAVALLRDTVLHHRVELVRQSAGRALLLLDKASRERGTP
jgi:HEAT repeat protein